MIQIWNHYYFLNFFLMARDIIMILMIMIMQLVMKHIQNILSKEYLILIHDLDFIIAGWLGLTYNLKKLEIIKIIKDCGNKNKLIKYIVHQLLLNLYKDLHIQIQISLMNL